MPEIATTHYWELAGVSRVQQAWISGEKDIQQQETDPWLNLHDSDNARSLEAKYYHKRIWATNITQLDNQQYRNSDKWNESN